MNRIFYVFFLTITTMCAIFTSPTQAQPSTQYYYRGVVYSTQDNSDEQKFYPYLPVTIAPRENPDNILGTVVTNAFKLYSFKGIPVDVTKHYIITIIGPDKERKYTFFGSENALKFNPGNIDGDVLLENDFPTYYTAEEFVPKSEDGNLTLQEWLQKCYPDLKVENGECLSKETDNTIVVQVNGQIIPKEKLDAFLTRFPMSSGLVKKVIIAKLQGLCADYFSAVIDIRVNGVQEPQERDGRGRLPELKPDEL